MNYPIDKAGHPRVIGTSILIALLIGLISGAATASDTVKAAPSDGFSALLAAHDEKSARPGDTEQLPQASPMAKLRTPTMVNAPMWSVIRAYYGPDGELMWGCAIEHRPLSEQPGNQIPD